jgi:hypothetical protein
MLDLDQIRSSCILCSLSASLMQTNALLDPRPVRQCDGPTLGKGYHRESPLFRSLLVQPSTPQGRNRKLRRPHSLFIRPMSLAILQGAKSARTEADHQS